MSRFLFRYLEIFSVIGDGTPENPGGDFDMWCWIDAPNQDNALEWGHVLLGNYFKARFAWATENDKHNGSPVCEGEIIIDSETITRAENWNLPSCRIGEIPVWDEPWRISNIRRHGPI